MNASLSIVIPSYNHALYLEGAIESVLSQDIPDLELIVVDDGSKDNSVKLLEELSSKYKFSLFCQENQGAHAAINRAIRESSGQYVSILNSDDLYHADRLRLLLERAGDEGASFIYSAVAFIDEAGRTIMDHPRAREFRRIWEVSSDAPGPEHFLAGNPATTTSNFFFTRKLWEQAGPFRNLRYTHDWDWALRASTIAAPLRLEESLLSYRVHESNTLNEADAWRHIAENAFIFASHFKRAGLGPPGGASDDVMRRYFDLLLENDSFVPIPTLLFSV